MFIKLLKLLSAAFLGLVFFSFERNLGLGVGVFLAAWAIISSQHTPTNNRAPYIHPYTGDMIIGPETGMTSDGDFIPPMD